MNLKKFFYRDYYKGVNWNIKPDKEQFSSAHTEHFKGQNKKLVDFQLNEQAVAKLDFSGQSAKPVNVFKLKTHYPGLLIGSGYTHETGAEGELKLGFFFDHTTGLPVLPGSTVKGVLRNAFPRFAAAANDPLKIVYISAEQKTKSALIAALFQIDRNDHEKVHALELSIFEGIDLVETRKEREEALKKRQMASDKTITLPMSLRDIFLDAFICKGDEKGKILETDVLTPHGKNPLKNPIPLPFLKIRPEVTFKFQFLLKATTFSDGTTITAEQKESAFQLLFTVFGIGAKTNVGYGQLTAS